MPNFHIVSVRESFPDSCLSNIHNALCIVFEELYEKNGKTHARILSEVYKDAPNQEEIVTAEAFATSTEGYCLDGSLRLKEVLEENFPGRFKFQILRGLNCHYFPEHYALAIQTNLGEIFAFSPANFRNGSYYNRFPCYKGKEIDRLTQGLKATELREIFKGLEEIEGGDWTALPIEDFQTNAITKEH